MLPYLSLLLGANIRCIPEFVSTYVFVNVHPVFSVESLAFLLAATMVTGRKIGSLLVLHHAEVIVSLAQYGTFTSNVAPLFGKELLRRRHTKTKHAVCLNWCDILIFFLFCFKVFIKDFNASLVHLLAWVLLKFFELVQASIFIKNVAVVQVELQANVKNLVGCLQCHINDLGIFDVQGGRDGTESFLLDEAAQMIVSASGKDVGDKPDGLTADFPFVIAGHLHNSLHEAFFLK